MKILSVVLLSLFVYSNALSIAVVKRDAKEDLLIETERLRKLAADEIAKLKAEGKTALAGGLEQLDKIVVDLETQLHGLNPQTAIGKGLLAVIEAGLKKVETDLEAEIKKLSGGFYATDPKDELLAQADKLKKLAADEIAKLKAEGKTALAGGLEKLDKIVIDFETQLKGLNPKTEVGKGLLAVIEAGLKKVETDLEAEIKKLSGGFFADDLKEQLMIQTEKLRKLAADEIAKLKAEGKTALAGGLEKLDKIVIDFETQLKGLNPQTEIGKGLLAVIEAGLKKAETNLEAEIKKLSGSFYADDPKDDLLAQTDKLKKLAADEIEKLKSLGKHELAVGIERLEKIIIDLETQLHALNPQTAIGKGLLSLIEAGIKRVETALEDEIKKLSGSFFAADPKDDLLAQTDKLKKLAADEIEKLKSLGKHELAVGIEKLEKIIIDLETQLHALNPQTAIGKGLLAVIEAGIKRVETALEDEIKKLSGNFYVDDELAKILAKLEEEKKKLSGSDELEALQKKIEEEMKKAMGGYYADDLKEQLMIQTEKLRKLAADEIAKLKAEGKTALAGRLEKLDKIVIDFETQLKGLNPQTEIGKGLLAVIEAGLKKVETDLEAEIKKLSGGFYEGDDELEKLKAQLEEEKKKMGSTSPIIDNIRAKIEEELKKLEGGFF